MGNEVKKKQQKCVISSWHEDSKYFFDFQTINLYQPPLLVNSLDGTRCPLSADESKFLLVGQHWCGQPTIGKCSSVCPYFSSIAQHALFVLLGWFV